MITKKKVKRFALLVLGMHRSGSFALSGVLARMGCTTPLTQIKPGPQNSNRFFESKRIARLNDRGLNACGSSWDDWRPLASFDHRSSQGQQLRQEAAKLIREEFSGADLIVLKDPRICRLVPIWMDALSAEHYRPVPVLIHRNPYEVAQSLQARNGYPLAFGLLLWLRYVLDAERLTRGTARTFTSHDSLSNDWRALIEALRNGIDIGFPVAIEAAEPSIGEFLSANLKHVSVIPELSVTDPTLSECVHQCFLIMQRWTAGGERKDDYDALNQLHLTLMAQSWTFVEASRETKRVGQLVDALNVAKARSATLEEQGAQELRRRLVTERMLVDIQGSFTCASVELQELRDDINRLNKELGALARFVKDLQEQRGEAAAQVIELKGSLRTSEEARAIIEQQIRSVLESSTWRVTAPVRRALSKIKSLVPSRLAGDSNSRAG